MHAPISADDGRGCTTILAVALHHLAASFIFGCVPAWQCNEVMLTRDNLSLVQILQKGSALHGDTLRAFALGSAARSRRSCGALSGAAAQQHLSGVGQTTHSRTLSFSTHTALAAAGAHTTAIEVTREGRGCCATGVVEALHLLGTRGSTTHRGEFLNAARPTVMIGLLGVCCVWGKLCMPCCCPLSRSAIQVVHRNPSLAGETAVCCCCRPFHAVTVYAARRQCDGAASSRRHDLGGKRRTLQRSDPCRRRSERKAAGGSGGRACTHDHSQPTAYGRRRCCRRSRRRHHAVIAATVAITSPRSGVCNSGWHWRDSCSTP